MGLELQAPSGDPAKATKRPPLAVVLTDVVTASHQLDLHGFDPLWNSLKLLDSRQRDLLANHFGRLIKNTGDGILAVFPSAATAFDFSINLIESLKQNPITIGDGNLSLRIGIGYGDLEGFETVYGYEVTGPAVNLAARCSMFAGNGEIALTDETADALADYTAILQHAATERAHIKGHGQAKIYRISPQSRPQPGAITK